MHRFRLSALSLALAAGLLATAAQATPARIAVPKGKIARFGDVLMIVGAYDPLAAGKDQGKACPMAGVRQTVSSDQACGFNAEGAYICCPATCTYTCNADRGLPGPGPALYWNTESCTVTGACSAAEPGVGGRFTIFETQMPY